LQRLIGSLIDNLSGVAETDGVGDVDTIKEGEGVGVGAGKLDEEGVGELVGFGTSTPLLQINFFPDLVQVYCLPLRIFVIPSFEHFDPGFGGVIAYAWSVESENIRTIAQATLLITQL
jgi:hypothetical protein